jgi:hypothetical protein
MNPPLISRASVVPARREPKRYDAEMRQKRPLSVAACAAASTCAVLIACTSLDGLTGPDDKPAPSEEASTVADAERVPDSTTVQQDAQADTNTPPDVDSGPCNRAAPWGTPQPITELNSSSDEWAPRLTSDELTIVFASARSGGPGLVSIYVATRASRLLPFSDVQVLPGPVNGTGISVHPSITGDGRTIYYQSKTTTTGTSGPDRIWRATRSNTFSPFGVGTIVPDLAPLNAGDYDLTPFVGSDGTRVVFASSRGTTIPDFDLYEAVAKPNGGFDVPVRIPIVNHTPARDDTPVLSADGLTLYFSSWRLDETTGNLDVFQASRMSLAAPFGMPVQINELATTSYEAAGWVSPDNCRMYLLSNRVVDGGAGMLDLFVSSKPPSP